MKWEDYGISKHRYLELQAFCLQYPEKAEAIERGLTSHTDLADRAPGGSPGYGSTVESQAERNVMFHADCLLIESAAMRADPSISRWILRSVTEGLSYAELGDVPMSSSRFYDRRRLFYAILDRMQRKRICG